jgi:hypothetical protein
MAPKLSMTTLLAAAAALGATGAEFGLDGTQNVKKRHVLPNVRQRTIRKSAGGHLTDTGNARGRPWAYKANRNDPCPCGSGVKFKKCCYGLAASSIPAPTAPSEPTEETT